MSVNLKLRRYIPSISRLTFIPVVRAMLDWFDVIPRMIYPEFRTIPPNHLRVRVGVSNRLISNQVLHIKRTSAQWLYWFGAGWCDLDSNIVELGVGCGRGARHVRDIAHHGDGYRGHYLGIDIDEEALEWCRANFDERFEFVHSTHESSSYVNDASQPGEYRIPRDDGTVDFIIGLSVFSHLLEDAVRNYLEEGARVLRPGGRMVVTCFCIDLRPVKVGDRHSFSHQLGNSFVESLAQPEAAVAYDSEFMRELGLKAGFRHADVLHDDRDVQHSLVCTK